MSFEGPIWNECIARHLLKEEMVSIDIDIKRRLGSMNRSSSNHSRSE